MTAPAVRGSTTIADKAVRKIAERAAGEVLPAALAGTAKGSASVHGRRASIALDVALPYPAPLSETLRSVQQHVTDRTRQLTGLEVTSPHVSVTRLAGHKAGATESAPMAPADAPVPASTRSARRWWSARRAPMAVVVLVAATACAAVTADVIRVHATHHAAAAWRLRVVDWLAGHGPGDLAVTIAALAAAGAGAWLLAMAFTPGRRGQLTLTADDKRANIAVDRSTVATLVRDAVGDFEGVEAVRVRPGRRRLTVRASLAFGDRETALRRATDATDRVLADCLLRRTLRRTVTVTTEPTWQTPLRTADPARTKAEQRGPTP
ncbi:DUF6286 domain-containing Asp23/Gls24 family envelope stress response protein [Streptomyces sp. NPDC049949]|uniref:DUF6286 domain-containing Asp23/Gls24 family envelope stress response protein n=1 Tax=Streptomyces sp. NPDC049949 TaxID=3154627 RepID=UPI00341D2F48